MILMKDKKINVCRKYPQEIKDKFYLVQFFKQTLRCR